MLINITFTLIHYKIQNTRRYHREHGNTFNTAAMSDWGCTPEAHNFKIKNLENLEI